MELEQIIGGIQLGHGRVFGTLQMVYQDLQSMAFRGYNSGHFLPILHLAKLQQCHLTTMQQTRLHPARLMARYPVLEKVPMQSRIKELVLLLGGWLTSEHLTDYLQSPYTRARTAQHRGRMSRFGLEMMEQMVGMEIQLVQRAWYPWLEVQHTLVVPLGAMLLSTD